MPSSALITSIGSLFESAAWKSKSPPAPLERIEVALGDAPDLVLERGDAPRREALGDEVAHLHVARRIHADDREQLARDLAAILERRPERRAVGLPVERRLPDVLEAEERVEIHLRVVGAGLVVAEVAVERVRIFLERARVRVVDHVGSLAGHPFYIR